MDGSRGEREKDGRVETVARVKTVARVDTVARVEMVVRVQRQRAPLICYLTGGGGVVISTVTDVSRPLCLPRVSY